jgi:hypothetical protein
MKDNKIKRISKNQLKIFSPQQLYILPLTTPNHQKEFTISKVTIQVFIFLRVQTKFSANLWRKIGFQVLKSLIGRQ